MLASRFCRSRIENWPVAELNIGEGAQFIAIPLPNGLVVINSPETDFVKLCAVNLAVPHFPLHNLYQRLSWRKHLADLHCRHAEAGKCVEQSGGIGAGNGEQQPAGSLGIPISPMCI